MRHLVISPGLANALELLWSIDILDTIIVLADFLTHFDPDLVNALRGHGLDRLARKTPVAVCLSDREDRATFELLEEVRQQLVDRSVVLVDIHERTDLITCLGDDLKVMDISKAKDRVGVKQEFAVAF